jgi:transcription elongation factor SPT5
MSDDEDLAVLRGTVQGENPKKRHRREVKDDEAALAAIRAGLHASDDDEDEDLHDFSADEDSDAESQRGHAFLDNAASEASDDDAEPTDADRLHEEKQGAYIKEHKHRRAQILDEIFAGDDNEQIAKQMEERLRAQRQHQPLHEDYGGELGAADRYDSSQRFTAALLPRPSDPKVFAVKVRPGFTRLLVARLVNKCHAYLHGNNQQRIRQDLGIISAFSLDHVREWIYIEAHRKRFVETAISGLDHVFRFKISQVDPRELMQLMQRQSATKDELNVGQYVRVRHGPYEADIATVIAVSDEGHRAMVKLVPREDYINRERRDRRAGGNRGSRPPQKFFRPQLAIGARQDTSGNWFWDGCEFDTDGYLYKEFSARQLLVGDKCTPPSLDELVVYHNENRDAIEQAAAAFGGSRKTRALRPDEPVRVSGGQLSGIVGRVRETDVASGRATLETTVKGAKSVLTVNSADLVKHFEPGAHVIVESGPHSGESGVVLACEGAMVALVTDQTQRELWVESEACRASRMVSARPHKVGAHQLFDLVTLVDNTTVGCIALLVGNSATILTSQNMLQNTLLSNIKQTLREKMVVTDSLGNRVAKRDTVVVSAVDAPQQYSKLIGTVQQVYHNTLFIVSTKVRENAGLFAIDAKSVSRLEGRNKLRQQSDYIAPRVRERPAHPARAGPDRSALARSAAASVGSAHTVALGESDFS